MDTRLSDQHVRAYYRIADKIATAATTADATLKRWQAIARSMPRPPLHASTRFWTTSGRALAQTAHTEEADRLRGAQRWDPQHPRALPLADVRDPAGPSFAYHVEVDGEAVGSDEKLLSGWPLTMSRHASLTTSGKPCPTPSSSPSLPNGTLLTDEVYTAQVNRMFGDARTHEAINVFYKEWWHVGWLNAFPKPPALQTLARHDIFDPGADHLPAMTDEIRAMTDSSRSPRPGSYKDLLLSDLTFTRSPHLAALTASSRGSAPPLTSTSRWRAFGHPHPRPWPSDFIPSSAH